MHGVAPHMCGQATRSLLGGEAGGRSLGFLLHRINFPIADSGGFLPAKETASERHCNACGRKQ
jgi:hypothetical protein